VILSGAPLPGEVDRRRAVGNLGSRFYRSFDDVGIHLSESPRSYDAVIEVLAKLIYDHLDVTRGEAEVAVGHEC
jgi:hypothetical protein